ncbi:hypothetical protein NFI96_021755, partial [Prochilodus magdalenae]
TWKISRSPQKAQYQQSTDSALSGVTKRLQVARSAKLSSVLILLDLTAAFDTVNHKILLSVLTDLGITGTAWNWFESYLEYRHHQSKLSFGRLLLSSLINSGVQTTGSLASGEEKDGAYSCSSQQPSDLRIKTREPGLWSVVRFGAFADMEYLLHELEFRGYNEITEGKIITDYNSDRFRDRLQLDRNGGCLTIRNIRREDSGVYKLHIINRQRKVQSFSVVVYAPVSKPVIRNQPEDHPGSSTKSCSPLCTVENGKDVNLSWYAEKEIISSIRSRDSKWLDLPLNRTHLNKTTYTCVAANPVSNQTVQLDVTELCPNTVSNHYGVLTGVLISVLIFALSILFVWIWKKKTQEGKRYIFFFCNITISGFISDAGSVTLIQYSYTVYLLYSSKG